MDWGLGEGEIVGQRFVLLDEAGNFDFSLKGSRFFILCSVVMEDFGPAQRLLELRRELAWEGMNLPGGFHCTEDAQRVRDRVFDLIGRETLRIDATVFEKSKLRPAYHQDWSFYEFACFYHFKHVLPQIVDHTDHLLVIGGTIGTRAKKNDLAAALAGVVRRTSIAERTECVSWDASTDAGLQIADYCCWAIQRKWERNDPRSYVLIQSKLGSEFEMFRLGTKHFY